MMSFGMEAIKRRKLEVSVQDKVSRQLVKEAMSE
jgi:hypothetical protein